MVELTWRVTYCYTTSDISGTVPGDSEFFADETAALRRYLQLRTKGWSADDLTHQRQRRDLDRSSVALDRIAGWERVLGGRRSDD